MLLLFPFQVLVLGKVSSSMMGTFGALLEIILILYPKRSQYFPGVFLITFRTDETDCK